MAAPANGSPSEGEAETERVSEGPDKTRKGKREGGRNLEERECGNGRRKSSPKPCFLSEYRFLEPLVINKAFDRRGRKGRIG